ncbi:MAG: type I DNA topoisomerase, partial [Planctomycetota bacterium]|nr:type I DNA topoisomerase [Planctomycetota bacterium]
MGKKLVIVESPAKAKTINRYLGPDFIVLASMGHVRDLPTKVIGVDVEHDFAPQYEALAGRGKVLTQLRQYARKAPVVYLATDLDREGEAIAWHLAEALHLKPSQMFRVVFNEITASAIREAFANPRQIDLNKVNAQQARRILDRIVGYEVSPLLWKKVARGLSAGRVQTVAVRLIVEREREIDAFGPEEFWKIGGVFTPRIEATDRVAGAWDKFLARRDEKGNAPTKVAQQDFLFELGAFRAELTSWRGKRFAATSADEALAAAKALGLTALKVDRREDPKAKGVAKNLVEVTPQGRSSLPFTVSAIKHRESTSRPPAPFTTATLQQAASIYLRFTASRTMRLAQQLYEGVDIPGEGTVGLITYMRTDSTQLSRDSIEHVRAMIGADYGPGYLPEKPNLYSARERAQEAHEAVRPTDPRRHPDRMASSLSREQHLLYDLIWKRFVACQMTPARWNVTEATVAATTSEGPAEF